MFIMKGFVHGRCAGVVAGNCGVKTGDEVWRLSGGLTPFILRRLSAAPEAEQRLISPCYLGFHIFPTAFITIETELTLV
jgi:hypothetical protein